MDDNLVKLTVTMDVTIPQAIALKAMFRYWNILTNIGGSRPVAFYVDGDGDFHPNCQVTTSVDISKFEYLEKLARKLWLFDYNPVAWAMQNEQNERGDK